MVLLVTTLLSLVTMFDTVRNNSPDALELKSIEVNENFIISIISQSQYHRFSIKNLFINRFGFCVAHFSYFLH